MAMWQIINQKNKKRSRLIIQFGRHWVPATTRDGSLGVILEPLSSLLTSTAVPQDPPGPKHNDIAGIDFSFITKTWLRFPSLHARLTVSILRITNHQTNSSAGLLH